MSWNPNRRGLSKLNRAVLGVLGVDYGAPFSEYHTDLVVRVLADQGYKRIDVLNALVALQSWGYVTTTDTDTPARDSFWHLTGKQL